MKTNILDSRDKTSILSFLSALRAACDGTGITKGAALWLFYYIMRNVLAAE